MLVLSRQRDERVVIQCGPYQITVLVIDFRGDKVRLGFDAPKDVVIHREEVHQAIQRKKSQGDAKGLAGANAEQEMYLSGDHKQIYSPGSKQEG